MFIPSIAQILMACARLQCSLSWGFTRFPDGYREGSLASIFFLLFQGFLFPPLFFPILNEGSLHFFSFTRGVSDAMFRRC